MIIGNQHVSLRHRVLVYVGFYALSFPAFGALADTPGDALEEVVVTAQRRAENIQNVPISVVAQTAADLERAGISDIRDLGNVVPGLVFMSQGPFAEPEIRGVQSTIAQAGADSPVAIYLDGVYQPNQLANVFDLADIAQVEVLKGPQGTLFGRNATGGAISIHTIQPSFETKGNVTLDYGYYQGSNQGSPDEIAKGYITAPLIDHLLAFSLSGYVRSIAGYLTDDVTGGQSGRVKDTTLRLKLLLEPTDGVNVLLTGFEGNRFDNAAGSTTALHGNSSDAYYPGGVASTQPWHVASDLYQGGDPIYQHQSGLSLKADFKFPGAGTLTSISAYTNTSVRYDVDLSTGTSPACNASFVCLNFAENYPDAAFQQELDFTSDKFGPVSFVAGLFYYHDNAVFGADIEPVLYADGTANTSLPSQIGVDQTAVINTRSKAIFGELTYDFAKDWHAIAGLRYSDEDKWGVGSIVPRFPTTGDIYDHATTPRVSVRYDLTDEANVYFTYSKGYKSAILASFGQTNDYAQPEYLNSFEVGLKSTGEFYRATAAAFAYNYTNLQAQFWNGTASILANAKGAEMRGLEGDIQMRLTHALRLDAGFSWLGTARYDAFSGISYALPQTAGGMTQDIVNADGERMLKAPKVTGNLTGSYTADEPFGSFELSATQFYSSTYFFDLLQRVKQGGYGTLNAQLAFTPKSVSSLRLALFGRNITNKAYFQSTLLGPSSDAPVYSPPRELGISAGYSF